jgi:RHS repeat-associated protein
MAGGELAAGSLTHDETSPVGEPHPAPGTNQLVGDGYRRCLSESPRWDQFSRGVIRHWTNAFRAEVTTSRRSTSTRVTHTRADFDVDRYSVVNRYYDPSVGQFISVDPDVASTGQPYVFVGGDPVNATDPDGLFEAGPNGQACIGDTCNWAEQKTTAMEHDNLAAADTPVFGPPAPSSLSQKKTGSLSGTGPTRQGATAAAAVGVLNGLTSDAANIQLGADATTAVCWDCAEVTVLVSAIAGYSQTLTSCASFGISLFTHGGILRTGVDCSVGIAEAQWGDLIQAETVFHGIHYGGVVLDVAGRGVDWILGR